LRPKELTQQTAHISLKSQTQEIDSEEMQDVALFRDLLSAQFKRQKVKQTIICTFFVSCFFLRKMKLIF
jgi:anionic cell wall polymer biosynthesis LytR-Cps2A-Psr (LCP) family protein